MALFDGLKRSNSPYFEKPVLANFLLGWSAGAPLTIALAMVSTWLAFAGVDKKTIGLFAVITTPYVFKFLWAPLLDKVPLGFITRRLGLRRGWLLTLQALLVLAIIGLGTTEPAIDPVMTAVFALAITTLSASQDIVVDAYRLELMDDKQYGHGAAMYTYGYRAANLVTGMVLLYWAGFIGWSTTFYVAPFLLLPPILGVLFWLKEPKKPEAVFTIHEEERLQDALTSRGLKGRWARLVVWLNGTALLPFKEFASRDGWVALLIFVVLFKLADVLIAFMTSPFLVELNYSEIEMANANKFVGGILLWVGVFAGAALYRSLGLYRSLMVTAILMMGTNLMFVWLGTVEHLHLLNSSGDVIPHTYYALATTIGAENFASGLGGVAVITFLSGLTCKEFTATQYALLSALSGVGRMIFGSTSGYMAEAYGWSDFFIISALAAIPSIAMLWWLRKKGWGGMRDAASSDKDKATKSA